MRSVVAASVFAAMATWFKSQPDLVRLPWWLEEQVKAARIAAGWYPTDQDVYVLVLCSVSSTSSSSAKLVRAKRLPRQAPLTSELHRLANDALYDCLAARGIHNQGVWFWSSPNVGERDRVANRDIAVAYYGIEKPGREMFSVVAPLVLWPTLWPEMYAQIPVDVVSEF